LVKNKVTKQFIPEIKRFVTELAIKDTPWSEIATDLQKVMGTGKRWEWVRVVRTEYMNAADRSSMEQYKQMGVPLVKWNASRAGATCAICLELNGQLFSVDGGTKEYPIAPPLPHPQCRCNKLPVWGKSKYGAGATVDNPRGNDPESPETPELPQPPNAPIGPVRPPKVKLNDELFRSTQSKKLNDDLLELLEGSDGFNEAANEFKTNVSIRTEGESTKSGASAFLKNTGKNGTVDDIGVLSQNARGNVLRTGKFFNVKTKGNSIVEFKKLDFGERNPYSLSRIDIEEMIDGNDNYEIVKFKNRNVLVNKKSGNIEGYFTGKNFKWWTVSDADKFGKIDYDNLAWFAQHEAGHLIQVSKTDYMKKMRRAMIDHDISLTDALTEYGKTNELEFFTESYCAYLANPDKMKAASPKVFEFMEDLLYNIYEIERETITFAP